MSTSPCFMTDIFNINNNTFNFIDFQRLYKFKGVNTNSTDHFTSDFWDDMYYNA